MNKIVMVRTYGGEYIIGELNPMQGDSGKVSLLNPRLFAVMPLPGGQVRAGFQPVCMFDKDQDKETQVSTAQVWITVEEEKLPKEIVNGYRAEVSGIDIATPDDIAAVTASSQQQPGEFKL